ncbi:unnamed protein product [Effrenium voratum]|nr:unnamed protein product [Effrenium voratum]
MRAALQKVFLPLSITDEDSQRVLEARRSMDKLQQEVARLCYAAFPHLHCAGPKALLARIKQIEGLYCATGHLPAKRMALLGGASLELAEGSSAERMAEVQEERTLKEGEHGFRGGAEKGKVGFLFSPLGMRGGVGKALYQSDAAFQKAVENCHACYSCAISDGVSLDQFRSLVFGRFSSEPSSDELVWIFVLQYAFFQSIVAMGLFPDVVLGHSNGEYAAAVAAGVMSLQDAMGILLVRANALKKLARDEAGCMMTIKATASDVAEELAAASMPEVVISGFNSQFDTVISGPEPSVRIFCSRMRQFTIHFDAEGELGIEQVEILSDVTASPGQFSRIFQVAKIEAGIVRDWNEAHPGYEVLPSDLIVKVDGRNCCGEVRAPVRSLTFLKHGGVKCMELRAPAAMHSPLVAGVKEAVQHRAAQSNLLAPQNCQMVSSLTGASCGQEVASAEHWSGHDDTRPMRFEEAMLTMQGLGCTRFLELGLGLLAVARRCLLKSPSLTWESAMEWGGQLPHLQHVVQQMKGETDLDFTEDVQDARLGGKDELLMLGRLEPSLPEIIADDQTFFMLGLDSRHVEELYYKLKKEGFICKLMPGRSAKCWRNTLELESIVT